MHRNYFISGTFLGCILILQMVLSVCNAGTIDSVSLQPIDNTTSPSIPVTLSTHAENTSGQTLDRFKLEYNFPAGVEISNIQTQPASTRASVDYDKLRIKLRWESVPPNTVMTSTFEVSSPDVGSYQITPRRVEYRFLDDTKVSGSSNAALINIQLTSPPIANPGGPYSAVANESIAMNGSGSYDPDGDSISYLWDFGDDTTDNSINPGHAYDTAKTYIITLIVNDGVSNSAPVTTTATISEAIIPPSILAQPQDLTINEGTAATFTVSADGSLPLTYQWQKNGIDINGATTATYTSPSVSLADNGSVYNCVVSNLGGSISTIDAVLSVLPAIRVANNLLTLYDFKQGADASIIYDVGGYPYPLDLNISDLTAITWDVDGLMLNNPVNIASIQQAANIQSSISTSNEITVEAWISPASLSASAPAPIISFSEGTNFTNFTLGQDLQDFIVRQRTTATDSGGLPATTIPNTVDISLLHVVYTRDITGLTRLFVNSQEVHNATTLGSMDSWDSSLPLYLASDSASGGGNWLGKYHLMALYDRALTSQEIQQNYLIGSDINGQPRLLFDKDNIIFATNLGEPIADQSVVLGTTDNLSTPYNVNSDNPWLTVAPLSGNSPETLVLSVDTTGLTEGNYSAVLQASAASYQNISIPVELNILPPLNLVPLANAGIDQTINENSPASLDGSNSADSDGSIVSYNWVQTAGPAVTLTNATSVITTFTTPDVSTDVNLNFDLTVTDNVGATSTDSVIVTVQNVNQLPVANAGIDQSINEGSVVSLDASSSSDSDGTIASYNWIQTVGPSVTLTNASTAIATFTSPEVTTNTNMSFELTITDDLGAIATDLVVVTVQNVNQLPTANAGMDQTINEGSSVTIDASASSDVDGTITSYSWVQTAGPAVVVNNATSAIATFIAPAVTVNTNLIFELTVTDDLGATATDLLIVTVQNLIPGPTANADIDQTVNENTLVTLNGSGIAGSNGPIVSYSWVQIAGPAVTLINATSTIATFTAPEILTTANLTFELTVTDTQSAISTDTTVVTVNNVNQIPLANAGIDQSINEGVLVT